MARSFRRRGKGDDLRYAAVLDSLERRLLLDLMEQVHELLLPGEPTRVATGPGDGEPTDRDAFSDIVARMPGLGTGAPGGDAAVHGEGEAGAGDREGPVTGDDPATPEDPALRRLLPTGNREDPEAAAEFRRLTEDGLRYRKAETLRAAIAALTTRTDRVELTEPQAVATMVALTDVRLVLGERLGLQGDDDLDRLEESARALPDEHPLSQAVALYGFLTWLQEGLAGALLPAAGRG